MALKPTIYKLRIALSDLERNHYETLNLTVALHPSETQPRMMARVLAYCINTQAGLCFTKGLSEINQPDIWARSLDEQILLWIEIGEPSPERIKKAARLAQHVRVYSFNSKSDVWWSQNRSKMGQITADFFQFNHQQIEEFAQMLQRTMDLSVTITGQSAFIASNADQVEIDWRKLD